MASSFNPFKKKKKGAQAAEEAAEAAKAAAEEAAAGDDSLGLDRAKERIVQLEAQLETTASAVLDRLQQFFSLLQVDLPIDADLSFPDLGGVTKELKSMAESLKAEAMEELNQMAQDLKDQVGGAVDDLMDDAQEAGAGGLLDEVGGLFGDAVAEKRSQREKWRVREVAVVCVQLLAAAPHIPSAMAEELQGALIHRTALETNDKVTAVLGAGAELPKRLFELMAPPKEEEGGTAEPTAVEAEVVDPMDAAQTAMALQ